MKHRGATERAPKSGLWYAYVAGAQDHYVSLDGERWVKTRRLPNSDGSDDDTVRGELDHGDKPTYSIEYLKSIKARVYLPGSWL